MRRIEHQQQLPAVQRGDQRAIRTVRWLALGVGAVVFAVSAHAVQATPPAIEILSPKPNSLALVNTDVAFTVQVNSTNAGQFTVEWQFDWDGDVNNFAADASKIVSLSTFPADVRDASFVKSYTTARDVQRYRVRVTKDGETAEAQGVLNVTGGLTLNGFAYIGASTPRCTNNTNVTCQTDADCGAGQCGGDPLGWVSLQNTTCEDGSPLLYSVGVDSPETGGGTFARVTHNGWAGNTSGACGADRPLGLLTFNTAQCEDTGAWCDVDDPGDCGGSACLATGKPPSSAADGTYDYDGEDWATYKELNHLYTTYQEFSRDGGTYTSQRYPGQIAGWARFLTQKEYGESELGQNDLGWLRLRGPEAPRPADPNPPYYSFVTSQGFHGCTDCTASSEQCNTCTAVQVNPGDAESQWQTRSCASCSICAPNGLDTACDVCERCDAYGVSMNTQTSELSGYGWSSDFGWVRFSDISVIQAWLATRYGDIFAGGSITSAEPAPFGEANATYVIQANGSVDFRSKADLVQPSYPTEIALPKAANRYINVLGRLDFDELVLADTESNKEHRHGTTVRFNDFGDVPDVFNGTDDILGGTVYYHKGNLVINDAHQFRPGNSADGDAANDSGGGTIIVDGNLTINADVTYQSGGSGSLLKNIPSLAWLVRGNLTISGSVSRLDGAFFVLGCQGVDTFVCPNSDPNADGVVDTGASLDTSLTVNGLMVARTFNFRRDVTSREGSERILYDGRFLANPPPGLQDLAAVLPQIREVIP